MAELYRYYMSSSETNLQDVRTSLFQGNGLYTSSVKVNINEELQFSLPGVKIYFKHISDQLMNLNRL